MKYDGSVRCPTCSASVMIPDGDTPKHSRRKIALAEHTWTLHIERDALGQVIRPIRFKRIS